MVEISVEDEGPGIPEGKLEHIFDRFYSERPQGEKFGQHSGLGLSISRQIVEALRGRIAAENRREASATGCWARGSWCACRKHSAFMTGAPFADAARVLRTDTKVILHHSGISSRTV